MDLSTVGIRIPKHDFCLNLINKIKKPIVTTSINKHGNKPLNTINDIQNNFPQINLFKDDKINVDLVFREVKEVHLDDKQREMKKTGLIKFIEANYVSCVSEVKVFKEKAISLNKSLQDEHENI